MPLQKLRPASRKATKRLIPADQRQELRHVGTMVEAGQRAAEGQEQHFALAACTLLERAGERGPDIRRSNR